VHRWRFFYKKGTLSKLRKFDLGSRGGILHAISIPGTTLLGILQGFFPSIIIIIRYGNEYGRRAHLGLEIYYLVV
jgi:hypothetical protein